ncbi:phage tail tape measure protein [Ferirhizobium litorale]|uniref:Phage tail tape measure protein n=1 Tax=Ferirhizobium litorale TaxID=2927786 RepID=A0AAE3U600_9HYPH|nr:phage tail tape measure protein [Fererhizobium litorale]MDI7924599.1 phage tail tape measure protein [Fererhizobium litorale]
MTRTVEAQLRISAIDKTGQVLKGVAGKLGEVNRRAAALNRQQGVLARGSQAAYGAMLRYAAPAALAYGAKRAVTDFAAVERQMTRIGITADASAQEVSDAFATLQTETKKLALPVEQGITALDTMVASGMTLKEAMAFLPSVLATAQASGAATEDIANTGLKAASALKIEAGQLQRAFDIMVIGGKAGQFELKDMAQYIPGLANSFASLGYTGEEGLKQLVAILQTIREDTGDASSAATQAQNIFGKMFSEETGKKFANFGIDLRKEMQAAARAGEDAVSAFVRISKKVLDGDLSKLPLLFSDQEFRLGMQSLITSPESLQKFIDLMNSSEVDGTVWRDVNKVLGDTQASIDKLSSSWDKLWTSLGKNVARPAVPVMDTLSSTMDYNDTVQTAMEKQGSGFWSWESWKLPFREYAASAGSKSARSELDKLALAGGYSDPEFLRRMRQGPNMQQGPQLPEFPGGGTGAIPVPGERPANLSGLSPLPWSPPRELTPHGRGSSPAFANAGGLPTLSVPSSDDFKNALRIDIASLKDSGAEAGQKVADGGREAGKAVEESAAFFKVAGMDVGAALMSAAKMMHDAATKLNGAQIAVVNAGQGRVNADTGRSMPPSANSPGGGG